MAFISVSDPIPMNRVSNRKGGDICFSLQKHLLLVNFGNFHDQFLKKRVPDTLENISSFFTFQVEKYLYSIIPKGETKFIRTSIISHLRP